MKAETAIKLLEVLRSWWFVVPLILGSGALGTCSYLGHTDNAVLTKENTALIEENSILRTANEYAKCINCYRASNGWVCLCPTEHTGQTN